MSLTITIEYKPNIELKKERISIIIENTSYGALHLLANDIKNLSKVKLKSNSNSFTNSFTQTTYNELLEQLYIQLENKLNI